MNPNFSYLVSLSRSWHYNWSKFYYFKKHFGYLYALKKIFPNLIRSLKDMFISKIKKNNKNYMLHKTEFSAIISSIMNKPSSYRPFESELKNE